MSALAPLEKLAPSWKRVADGRGTPGLFRIMTKAKAGKKGRPATLESLASGASASPKAAAGSPGPAVAKPKVEQDAAEQTAAAAATTDGASAESLPAPEEEPEELD